MAEEWNERTISKSSNSRLSGRPDSMYFFAHLFNYQDYSDSLEADDIDGFLPVFEEIPINYSVELD